MNEHVEVHLSGKVQFLLDAVLGYITIEQNDLFKVLTIASVVGIPPTLMAGIYGMNFRFMPELDWAWGYPFGLAVILHLLSDISLRDAYLATTPGGIYAVLAVAFGSGANITFIVAVQSLRVIVSVVLAPLAVRRLARVGRPTA